MVVIGQSTSFVNNQIDEAALTTRSPETTALTIIDNLRGFSFEEGNTHGFDDWSTTVAIRGFQLNLSNRQIGTTIDGVANGNSGYGGGAKAGGYTDTDTATDALTGLSFDFVAKNATDGPSQSSMPGNAAYFGVLRKISIIVLADF